MQDDPEREDGVASVERRRFLAQGVKGGLPYVASLAGAASLVAGEAPAAKQVDAGPPPEGAEAPSAAMRDLERHAESFAADNPGLARLTDLDRYE